MQEEGGNEYASYHQGGESGQPAKQETSPESALLVQPLAEGADHKEGEIPHRKRKKTT